MGREGRAGLRSSTSELTHIQSSDKHTHWHQNTNIKGHTDNHIKTHSKSHMSVDTPTFKRQTSPCADIKKAPKPHMRDMRPVSPADQLWEVTQTWQSCYQASIKACRFKHGLLKSHQSQTLGSLISHLPFNTAVPAFHSALLFMLPALNSAF